MYVSAARLVRKVELDGDARGELLDERPHVDGGLEEVGRITE